MEGNYERKNFIRQVVKGGAGALIVTLLSVLLFALLLAVLPIGEGAIRPICQAIKLLSVFLGCIFAVRGEKGFVKGLLIGVFSSLLSALVFGLISGETSVSVVLIDAVCAGVMGMISGAITVNLPFGNG